WRIEVAPAADLKTITTTTCFDGERPSTLVPEERRAARYVVSAFDVLGRDERALVVSSGIDLATLRDGACVRVTLDLEKAEDGLDEQAVARTGDDLLSSPDVWLWHGDTVSGF